MKVPVRELKNRLSEYLRRVQEGEEVTVTSRGRAVARLLPPVTSPLDAEQETSQRLRALAFVRPPRGGKPEGSRSPTPWRPGEKTLSEIVLEERE